MKILLYFTLFTVFGFLVSWIRKKPSNERDWSDDQEILQHAEIDKNMVHLKNIRNFKYSSEFEYKKRYYDKSFDLEKIKKAYYVLVPFSRVKGVAHALLSFEFEESNFVAISIEIRKKKKDVYSPIKGLFRQYELMYVVGDENDLIKQRSEHRKNNVYVYPLRLDKDQTKELFLDMIKRVNKLKEEPEFYNTITNACVTNIIDHVNKILPTKVPFSLKVFLPEGSDKLAYIMRMIDTDKTFKDAKKIFLINNRVKNATEEDFSLKIRDY